MEKNVGVKNTPQRRVHYKICSSYMSSQQKAYANNYNIKKNIVNITEKYKSA